MTSPRAIPIRVLRAADIEQVLTPANCLAAVRSAMIATSAGNALLPLRHGMSLLSGRGTLGMMPGSLGDPECFGIKLVSFFPANRGSGRPSHLGLFVLYESDGLPIALLDASALTAIRTAAASVLATLTLARADSRRITILGTGEQAIAHIAAFVDAWPSLTFVIWGRNIARAEDLASAMRSQHDIQVSAEPDLAVAVEGSDIVCTLTSASEPVLGGALLESGMHLCVVGSSSSETREVDDEVVRRSRFFVDYRASAFAQAGELLHAISHGVVREDHVCGEIGDVLTGRVPGRLAEDDITLYKSVGIASQDLAAAWAAFSIASHHDIGSVILL